MTESWEFGEDSALTPEPGFPWPPPEDGPVLTSFATTWKGATFDPGRFFADTPREGGTGAALLYYLAIGIVVAGATLFWDSIPFMAGSTLAEDPLAAELGYGTTNPLVRFLLAPAILLFALFLSAGVVHVFLLIFRGANHGFGTTVRVFSYAYSPAIFGVVPILGPIVGGIWSVAISVIGLREAHETATWKPVVAVLIPVVGTMIFFMIAMLAVFMAGSVVPARL